MFKKDLKLGQKAEDLFADYLLSQGELRILKTYGLNKEFDIAIYNGDRILDTFEVKLDVLYQKTGNIAIEYRFKGDLSGIITTKAKYWVQVIKTPQNAKFYRLEVSGLREWLHLNKPFLKVVKGGDDNMSEMVLLSPGDIVNNTWCEIYEL